MKGLFITMEGVEGCGKTTQTALLRDYLSGLGRDVLVTREPGGTAIGEAIRAILLDRAHVAMSAWAELLLYAAARAQHVDEVIRPALAAGRIVLCDRFADSTTAYQGGGRALPSESIERLHEIAIRGVWPDLTLVIDVPPEEGLARARRALDRIESEPPSFHERVREAFCELARREPDRVKLVSGLQPVERVAAAVRTHVDALLSRA